MAKLVLACLAICLLSPLTTSSPLCLASAGCSKSPYTAPKSHDEELQVQQNILTPAKCECIQELSHDQDSDTTRGSYSYVDPLGQKVTVHYYDNGQKDGYEEERTITKQNTVDEEALVREITGGIEYEVEELIQKTIEDSDFSDAKTVVEEIVDKLTPTLTQGISNVLEKHDVDLEVEPVVDQIIKELTPIISQVVSRETGQAIIFPVARTDKLAAVQAKDVVKGVVKKLKPLVETTIVEAYTKRKDDDVDTRTRAIKASNSKAQTLIQKIVAKLTPIVAETVQTETDKTPTKVEDSDQQSDAVLEAKDIIKEDQFTDDVVDSLQVSIEEKVDEIVKPRPHYDQAYQVNQVLQAVGDDIQTEVRHQLRQRDVAVKSDFFHLPEYNVLLERILATIKPTVEQMVQEVSEKVVEEQKETILSDDFVDEVVEKIEPQVSYKIHTTLQGLSPENVSVDDMVQKVVSNLQPVIIQGVKAVLSRSRIVVPEDFFSSETFETLVDKIVTKLVPIIEEAVKDEDSRETDVALRSQQRLENKLLTDSFINQVVENIKKDFQEEIQRNLLALADGSLSDDEIVDEIADEMEHFILQTTVKTIKDKNIQVDKAFYRSDTFHTLVENVLTRFKANLKSQLVALDHPIVDEVVAEVKPLIPGSVEAVVKIYDSESEDQLIEKVIQGITEIVQKSVSKKLDNSATSSDKSTVSVEELVGPIINELRPVVASFVSLSRERIQLLKAEGIQDQQMGDDKTEEIIKEVIRRVRFTIRSYVQTVVDGKPPKDDSEEDKMIEKVIVYLRPSIEGILSLLTSDYPSLSDPETNEKLSEQIITRSRDIIQQEIKYETEAIQQANSVQRASGNGAPFNYRQNQASSPQMISGNGAPSNYGQNQASPTPTIYGNGAPSHYRQNQASSAHMISGNRAPSNYGHNQASSTPTVSRNGGAPSHYRQNQATSTQGISGNGATSDARHGTNQAGSVRSLFGDTRQETANAPGGNSASGTGGMMGMPGSFVTVKGPNYSYSYGVDK